MSVKMERSKNEADENVTLEADERWKAVQRILSTESFQRASQLRNLLIYVSKSAILHPLQTLREYDIACEVLERRQDFDPAADNIVRAQFTNLRRKLERYAVEDGKNDDLIVSIPKGQYTPIFVPRQIQVAADPVPGSLTRETTRERSEDPISIAMEGDAPARRWVLTMATSLAAVSILILGIWITKHSPEVKDVRPENMNAFVHLLAAAGGNVAVVLPDTSEMLIRVVSGVGISPADYSSQDFQKSQIDSVQDAQVRSVLQKLALRRNTSVGEAKVAFDFVTVLNQVGAHGTIRYARDLHVRDFNEGNTILIGSQHSDPWVSLFTSKLNFQFIQDPKTKAYYFQNMAPQPGEENRYDLSGVESKERRNYVDVVLTQNPSKSGYILLLNGSDTESNEAAANFLLRGQLPPELDSVLRRKDLRSFEIFLRGKHIVGDSEDTLQVISIRAQ